MQFRKLWEKLVTVLCKIINKIYKILKYIKYYKIFKYPKSRNVHVLICKLYRIVLLTLMGTHGYSGNAAATARAPASFVK